MNEPPRKPVRPAMRRLSDEEIALWAEVAKSVARRRGASLPPLPPPKPAPPASVTAAPPAKPGARSQALPAPKPKPMPLAPLERRLKRELSRGKTGVDEAIDLHGLNQAAAHSALRGFLSSAQARGSKLVIVVTGKGLARGRDNAPSWIDEPGVLRRVVPHWLREPDLRSIVLGFEEAGRAHGGSGALYVRLRRRGVR